MSWYELNWTACNCVEMHWIELNWSELSGTELEWGELNWTDLTWTGMNLYWTGVNWSASKWSELKKLNLIALNETELLLGELNWSALKTIEFKLNCTELTWTELNRAVHMSARGFFPGPKGYTIGFQGLAEYEWQTWIDSVRIKTWRNGSKFGKRIPCATFRSTNEQMLHSRYMCSWHTIPVFPQYTASELLCYINWVAWAIQRTEPSHGNAQHIGLLKPSYAVTALPLDIGVRTTTANFSLQLDGWIEIVVVHLTEEACTQPNEGFAHKRTGNPLSSTNSCSCPAHKLSKLVCLVDPA